MSQNKEPRQEAALGKVVRPPDLHHCPDCYAILQVLSAAELPADLRLRFVKHVA